MKDQQMEVWLGNLLRLGVAVAGAVVFLGGVLELLQHGHQTVNYSVFRAESASLRTPLGIVQGLGQLEPRHLIQFGLLLLVLTPILRVALAALLFARQRDGVFTLVTLGVLGVLLYSLTR